MNTYGSSDLDIKSIQNLRDMIHINAENFAEFPSGLYRISPSFELTAHQLDLYPLRDGAMELPGKGDFDLCLTLRSEIIDGSFVVEVDIA